MSPSHTLPVAIVTGGSHGIGRCIVERLHAGGHAVLFTHSSPDAEAAALQAALDPSARSCRALRLDVTAADAAPRLFDAAEALGPVAALVNNAGVTGRLGPIEALDDADLERILAVNLAAPVRLCREAARRWRGRQARSDIVNISSVAARTGSPGEYVAYAASKAALEALTVGLARELAPHRIHVNAVAPGTIDTTIHHPRARRRTRARGAGRRAHPDAASRPAGGSRRGGGLAAVRAGVLRDRQRACGHRRPVARRSAVPPPEHGGRMLPASPTRSTAMPLVTATVRKPKSAEFKTRLLDAVHAALVASGVPETDRFQRVLELEAADFRYDPSYPDLSSPRGEDFVLIEILWSAGRSVKVKKKLLADLMQRLEAQGLDPEQVMVCFKETTWENWAFAGGRLIHA